MAYIPIVVQVTQFHRRGHFAERQCSGEAFVDLTQLQALCDIALKAQLAARCRNVEQLAVERTLALEFAAVEFHIDQLRQLERGADRIAALVIHDGFGNTAVVATSAVEVANRQRLTRLPGNSHARKKALKAETLTFFQITFAIARDHFVQGNRLGIAVYADQEGLKALAALMKGDDQRIAALVQHPQVRGDLHRRAEHFRRLRSFFRA